MGTPAAVLYATISFGVTERHKILPRFFETIPFYKRFIDDVFAIWIPTTNSRKEDDTEWEEFKSSMNKFGKLKWVVSDRNTTVDFLDLTLTLTQGRITTRTFQKSVNLYLYLPPVSAHPEGCYKGLIVGNFLRFRKQNNDEDFKSLIATFAQNLFKRGHSIKSIRFQFQRAARLLEQKSLPPINSSVNTPTDPTEITACHSITNRSLFIHWEYHPNGLSKDNIR
jgi:hypothetical protein